MLYLRNHEIYVNYVRQLSPLYAISQKPWDLCQLCQIDNCLPCMLYLRNHEIYVKLYQIDNCFPCMFYLRNHEIYVKLYQTIVYLVHFISETMRAMSNYIRQLSPLYVLSQNPWELCQIISVRQLSPLYVLSQKPWVRELCQIISVRQLSPLYAISQKPWELCQTRWTVS